MQRRGEFKTKAALTIIKCENCGTEFKKKRSKKARFCSHKCHLEFYRGSNTIFWRGGKGSYRGPRWAEISEGIRRRDGYKCVKCGKPQLAGSRKLCVDHIIPWRAFDDKDAANHESNLESLCNSCHTKKTFNDELEWFPTRRSVDAVSKEEPLSCPTAPGIIEVSVQDAQAKS